MTGGSLQLRRYIADRRAGMTLEAAAALAGISITEAKLWDADEAKGELGWVAPINSFPQPAPCNRSIDRIEEGERGEGQVDVPMIRAPSNSHEGENNLRPTLGLKFGQPRAAASAHNDDGVKTMANENAPGITNLTSTKKVLAQAAKDFRDIDKKRKELNDWAGEVRERCRDMGIDPKWLLTAIRVSDLEPEAREKADESYAIAREAIGLKFRMSLFEEMETRQESEAVAEKVKGRAKAKLAAVPDAPYEGDNEDLAGD